jgi:hypothetical protein
MTRQPGRKFWVAVLALGAIFLASTVMVYTGHMTAAEWSNCMKTAVPLTAGPYFAANAAAKFGGARG